jgi:hypothetical protein
MNNEHHYALVHHPQEGILQVDQRLTSHLVFRPTSTNGLAAQLDAASIERKKQTKAVLVMEDPEKQQRQQAEVISNIMVNLVIIDANANNNIG